jgi:hypothetical protein
VKDLGIKILDPGAPVEVVPVSLAQRVAEKVIGVANKVRAKATPEEAGRRYAICGACDQLLPNGRCRQCGCPMASKTQLQTAACPLNKW